MKTQHSKKKKKNFHAGDFLVDDVLQSGRPAKVDRDKI